MPDNTTDVAVETPPASADSDALETPGAGEQTSAPAPPAESADKTEQRVKDAQRLMHEATTRAAEVKKRLDAILGHPEAGPLAKQVIEGTPAPAVKAPESGEDLDRQIEALYAQYSDPALDEKAAFSLLVKELFKLAGSRFNPVDREKFLDDAYSHTLERMGRQVRLNATGETIEKFWQESAPHIPLKLLWSYADEAQTGHPNDIEKQMLFCLERAIRDMGPAAEHLTSKAREHEALQRGQGAGLPGGGMRTVTGEPSAVKSFVQQVKELSLGQLRP